MRDARAIEKGIRWASQLEPNVVWDVAPKVLKDNSWALSAKRQLNDVYLA
jgi:hypothetical protein